MRFNHSFCCFRHLLVSFIGLIYQILGLYIKSISGAQFAIVFCYETEFMALRTLFKTLAASCFTVSVASFAYAEEVTYIAGDTFRDALNDGSMGPEMVVVPSGKFLMGSPETEKDYHFHFTEVPQVEIMISKPFAVGKFELTWDE